MPLLSLHKLTKNFGSIKALDNLSFEVEKGQTVGLIGPNGSGKSTLFNAIMNVFPVDSGTIIFDKIDITGLPTHTIARHGIARTFQDARPLPQITVGENLDISFNYETSITLKNIFFKSRLLRAEQKRNLEKIRELLKKVSLQSKENALASSLSYGQGKLLEILKILASGSRLILLDEPFSGLFPEMIKIISSIIRELAKEGKTIILIEHNMKLIEEICSRIIVLDAGRKIAEGSFAQVTREKIVIESYLGK